MCGLVGVAGKTNYAEEKAFKMLLKLDTVRGPHSTGIAFINHAGGAEVLKKLGTPWELEQYVQYGNMFKYSYAALLGHNRWATSGAINAINAHPFECGHITGMHNGTLKSQTTLLDWRMFEVDSENIYHHMSHKGVEDTVKNLNGAFALVWHDSKEDTLNLVRNNERPLWVCPTNNGETLFWASEPWMLRVALGNSGVKFDNKDVVQIPVGEHWKVDLQSVKVLNITKNKLELYQPLLTVWPTKGNKDCPHLEKYKDKVVSFIPDKMNSMAMPTYLRGFVEGDLDAPAQVLGLTKARMNELWEVDISECEIRAKVVRIDSYNQRIVLAPALIEVVERAKEKKTEPEVFYDYKGNGISGEEWLKRTDGGCSWCTTQPSLGEEVRWIGHSQFICADCIDIPDVQQHLENH